MNMVSNTTQSPTIGRDIQDIVNQRPQHPDPTQKTTPQGSSAESKAAEYIPGSKTGSTGLYRLGKDDNGDSKIIYEDPAKQSSEAKEAKSAPVKMSEDKNDTEECTGNTDNVDAEIKKLKEKVAALEQKISQAKDDPDKQNKLQKQLLQAENELRSKDNDTYRRQNTEFTNS